jgi:Poxvirus A22 protein
MKLISFDIGLRNLSVCVLEGTSRKDIKILHWEIIDVLGEKAGVGAARCHKCSAAACYEHASEGTFSCSKHVPSKGKEKITKGVLNKKTIFELQGEIDKCGLRTDATKKPDLVNLLFNHLRQNTWKKCVKSAVSGSVLDLAPDIIKCLEARMEHWKNADLVVLENQPERRMYAVQAMIHMYFSTKGFKCSGISATHKLSNIVTIDDVVHTYKGRKKTGITHAYALVPPQHHAFFDKHKKKDDLADSFLQGLWALEHSR